MDEFGKALETARDSGDTDPYILQQLAEAGQGGGLPIFILTLQHLAFEDTLAGADAGLRREWGKVQGRFEDLTYVDSPEATRTMIASVFRQRDRTVRRRVLDWAKRHSRDLIELGVTATSGRRAFDPKAIAGCYPLHPLAALILPELTSRYGQHERTLFSFLAGRDPSGAAAFLAATESPPARAPLPSVGLSEVYDFFVGGGAATAAALAQSSRWAEIATRLRDAHGLSPRETRLAKSVAVLNLVSTGGSLRASRDVLLLAEPEAEADLATLEERGVITRRDVADEYRIWQGSETDIRGLLETCRMRLAPEPLAILLAELAPPPPAVAARHSAQHDLVRVFSFRFVGSSEPPERPEPSSPFDGEVLLFVGPEGEAPRSARPEDGKPLLLAIPENVEGLDRAAREVAAVRMAMADLKVASDPVARNEFRERLVHAQSEFDRMISKTFRGESCRWQWLGPEPRLLRGGRGSAALSEAADLAYPDTPIIRNEMLHRTELSSQGAKARRDLLAAMIEKSAEPDLGLRGYGPDMAMYRAALHETGIHRGGGAGRFGPPRGNSSLAPAWELVTGRFFAEARGQRINVRDITAALLSPPIGMKAGAVPVLLTAALLAFRDEIAIYEHGTFKPALTSQISERMVKNPAHFEIKYFAAATGARGDLVAALREQLGVPQTAGADLVAVVRRLVSAASRWDLFSRRTARFGPRALAMRDAILTAVEPDELIFTALPRALGFPAAEFSKARYPEARKLASEAAAAFAELQGHRKELLSGLVRTLLEESGAASRSVVTHSAAALGDSVSDPDLRAFALALANEAPQSDEDWVSAIATVVAKKAPSEWNDADHDRFQHELKHRVAAFRRLLALRAEKSLRAFPGRPFSAFRVIFTRPDGHEYIGLAAVEDDVRDAVSRVLDQALTSPALGTSTRERTETLLAVLGERLIGEQADSSAGEPTTLAERRAASA